MTYRRRRIGLFLAVVLLIANASRAAAPASKPASQPVSADMRAMLSAIEASMNKGDGKAVDQYFDTAAFIADVTKDLPQPLGSKIAQDLKTELKFGPQFKAALGPSGSYHFLRVHQDAADGSSRALFRMISANGLNYHDLVLGLDAQGKPVFKDVFVFVSGEMMSQTMKRTFKQMLAGQQQGKPMDDYARGMLRLAEMRQLIAQQRGAEALKIYDQLPEAAKGDKAMQIVRMTAASQADEAAYKAALDDFEKRFKGDSSLELMQIDQQFMRKDYAAVGKTLDRLDARVGGDPYLNLMRANARMIQNDLSGAKQFAAKAAAAEPGLYDAHDALLMISLKEKNHAETAKQLALFEDHFGMAFQDLANAPDFADFVQSPEYQAWLKRPRPKAATTKP